MTPKADTRSTHTPGPWTATPDDSGPLGTYTITGSNGLIVTTLPEGLPDRAHGDARLIAAAPEMAEALRAVFQCFEDGSFVRNTDSDGLSDWAIRAVKPLKALADIKALLARIDGTTEGGDK